MKHLQVPMCSTFSLQTVWRQPSLWEAGWPAQSPCDLMMIAKDRPQFRKEMSPLYLMLLPLFTRPASQNQYSTTLNWNTSVEALKKLIPNIYKILYILIVKT